MNPINGEPREGAVTRPRPSVRLGTFSSFGNIGFRYLWSSNVVGQLGFVMQTLVLGWFVLEETGRVWDVALVGFFMEVPRLFLSPVGGSLSDRFERKFVMIAGVGVICGAWLLLTSAFYLGFLNLYLTLGIAIFTGVGRAIDQPARHAIVYDLLGSSGTLNGYSLDSVGRHVGGVVGFALGGRLIEVVGYKGTFSIITGFFLATLFLIWMIRGVERQERDSQGSIGRSLMEGIHYVGGQEVILGVLAVTLLWNCLVSPIHLLIPVFGDQILHVGPFYTGLLLSVERFTMVLGAMVMASRPQLRRPGLMFFGGTVLMPWIYLAFAWSTWYPLALFVFFVVGIAHAPFSVLQPPIILRTAQANMRGRTMGLLMLARSFGVPGVLLMGGLVALLGPQMGLTVSLIAGIGLISLVVIPLPALLKVRWQEAGTRTL